MKNKKGFTLVELLAVIAILAILVILAIPNVIKLYNNAKKQVFLTEARTVHKEAVNKYLSESLKGNKVSVINSNGTKLDLSSSKKLKYNVKLDSKGNIKKIKVENDQYCISGNFKNSSDLTIDKVTEGKCADVDAVYCDSGISDLTKGSEFKKGIYTYHYMQQGDFDKSTRKYIWSDINSNGWGVVISDRDSTEPISENPCTYIDNIPVVSMRDLFASSKATSITLSNINTSHVVNMAAMFSGSKVQTLDISDFDTSSVTSMDGMFEAVTLKNIDVSSFDTSNVTSMSYMFNGGSLFDIKEINIIGLNNFDTSKVTDMSYMFAFRKSDELDVSNFNTSNVTNMHAMFDCTYVKLLKGLNNFNTSKVTDMSSMFWIFRTDNSLDVSSFNTSNVTDMGYMFVGVSVPIDLSHFDTSNVTSMSHMFNATKVSSLDLSTFNTSKVTDMSGMFASSEISDVKGLNNFDTSKVTDMSYMFKSALMTSLDLSSFTLSADVKLDSMFMEAKATTGYAKDQTIADKFNDDGVTKIPDTLKFAVK